MLFYTRSIVVTYKKRLETDGALRCRCPTHTIKKSRSRAHGFSLTKSKRRRRRRAGGKHAKRLRSGQGIDSKQIIEDFVYVVRKHHVLRQQREDPFCGCGVLGQLLDADLVGGVADDPCGQSVACGCVKQLIRDFDFRAGYCRFGKQVGRCYFRCQFYHSLTLFDVQPLYSIFAMRQAAEISTVCTNPCRFFRRNRTKSLRSCPESRFVFRQAALQRGKALHLSC